MKDINKGCKDETKYYSHWSPSCFSHGWLMTRKNGNCIEDRPCRWYEKVWALWFILKRYRNTGLWNCKFSRWRSL